MFHLRLLLKFPIHHCTLQLPHVTSHRSKNSVLSTLNKWTLLPSAPFKGKRQTHLLSSPSGLSTFPVFHKSFRFYGKQWVKERIAWYAKIPRGMPVPQCTGTGCWEQDQCQQQLCPSEDIQNSLTVPRDLRPPHTEPTFACRSLGSH